MAEKEDLNIVIKDNLSALNRRVAQLSKELGISANTASKFQTILGETVKNLSKDTDRAVGNLSDASDQLKILKKEADLSNASVNLLHKTMQSDRLATQIGKQTAAQLALNKAKLAEKTLGLNGLTEIKQVRALVVEQERLLGIYKAKGVQGAALERSTERLLRLQQKESVIAEKNKELAFTNSLVTQDQRALQRALTPSSGLLAIQGRLMLNYTVFNSLKGAISGVINELTSYNEGLTQLQAISEATDTQMSKMNETILNTSKVSMWTSRALADVATLLAQAGYSVQQIEGLLPAVTKLATAGGTDPETAANLVTTIMDVFDKRADESVSVANSLTAVVNKSKASIEGLAVGFQYAANVAAQLNISFEDLTALMGAATQAGIRSKSMLGTGLASMFNEMIKPSASLQAQLKAVGLSLDDIDVRAKGVIPVLQKMAEKGFGAENAFAGMNKRAARMYVALSKQTDYMKKLSTEIVGTTAAIDANDIRMEGWNASVQRLGNSLGAIVQHLGQEGLSGIATPAVSGLADVFGALDNILQELPASLKSTVSIVATATVAVASLGAAVFTMNLFLGESMLKLKGWRTAVAFMSSASGLGGLTLAIAGALAVLKVFDVLIETSEEKLEKLKTAVNDSSAALEEKKQVLDNLDSVYTNFIDKASILGDNEQELRKEIKKANSSLISQGYYIDETSSSLEEVIKAINRLREETREGISIKIELNQQSLQEQLTELKKLQKFASQNLSNSILFSGTVKNKEVRRDAVASKESGWTNGALSRIMSVANQTGGKQGSFLREKADNVLGLNTQVNQVQAKINENQAQLVANNYLNSSEYQKKYTDVIDSMLIATKDKISSAKKGDTSQASTAIIEKQKEVAQELLDSVLTRDTFTSDGGEASGRANELIRSKITEQIGGVISLTGAYLVKAHKEANKQAQSEYKRFSNDLRNVEKGLSMSSLSDIRKNKEKYLAGFDEQINNLNNLGLDPKDLEKQKASILESKTLFLQKVDAIQKNLEGMVNPYLTYLDSVDSALKRGKSANEAKLNELAQRSARISYKQGLPGLDDTEMDSLAQQGRSVRTEELSAQLTTMAGRLAVVNKVLEGLTASNAGKEITSNYNNAKNNYDSAKERQASGSISQSEFSQIQAKYTQAEKNYDSYTKYVTQAKQEQLELTQSTYEKQEELNDLTRDYSNDQVDILGRMNTANQEFIYSHRQLASVGGNFASVYKTALNSADTEFGSFVNNVMTGTAKVSDAFKDMAISILQAIEKILAQQVASSILTAVIGGFGGETATTAATAAGSTTTYTSASGDVVGQSSVNFRQFAEGGLVTGGIPGKDSVRSMLMPGEYVLNKKAVENMGLGNLEKMNSGSSSGATSISEASNKYASSKSPTAVQSVNVWTVMPEEVPQPSDKDIIAVVHRSMATPGSTTRKLVQSVNNGV